MANLYRWYILDMDVVPVLGIYTDVVTRVGWRYHSIDTSGFTADLFGHTQLPPPPCQCYYHSITITQQDINSATGNTTQDGIVFVNYNDGNNAINVATFTSAGTFNDTLPCCSINYIYYYENDIIITSGTSSYTTGGVAPQTPPDPGFVYIAYPDLTEQQVVSWVEMYSDVPALQANLDNQMYEKANPVILNLPLPWQ